jgi:glyoxylate/hydroxypyruvate reductase
MKITFCCKDTPPERWIEGLQQALGDAEISVWTPGAPPAELAIVWAPPQQFIDEQPGLKYLFNIGAGVDALLQLRLPEGLAIVRLDDAGMAVQMAEYVCHAVIRHFREFDGYERDMQAGAWTYRKPRRREEFPVGVMGLGVLGARVARALQMFEFPVNAYSLRPRQLDGVACYHGRDALPEFLAASRVLVNMLPLTPDTENILDIATLSQLRPGGYLVNVARGRHVVDADLLTLLERGHLAGATLDVFRSEPLVDTHPFWQHPKITLTPHTSARTLRDLSIAQIVDKIRAIMRGAAIAGVVDRSLGY